MSDDNWTARSDKFDIGKANTAAFEFVRSLTEEDNKWSSHLDSPDPNQMSAGILESTEDLGDPHGAQQHLRPGGKLRTDEAEYEKLKDLLLRAGRAARGDTGVLVT
jgi:hypothetical protein